MTDMHEDGSLQEELLGATTSGTNGSVAANGTAHNCLGSQSLDERLGALVREQPVMLFMKVLYFITGRSPYTDDVCLLPSSAVLMTFFCTTQLL